MPRTLTLFMFERKNFFPLVKKGELEKRLKVKAKERSLRELAEEAERIGDKKTQRGVARLFRRVKDARLNYEGRMPKGFKLKFSCVKLVKTRVGSKTVVYEWPVEVKCWLRVNSALLAVLDTPDYTLARYLSMLVSLVVMGDYKLVSPFRFKGEDVESIENWLTGYTSKKPGKLVSVVLTGVDIGEERFDRVLLKHPLLARTVTYSELRGKSRGVTCLTGVTPVGKELRRPLSFMLNASIGKITIYTPKVTDGEVEGFLSAIELSLIHI